MAGNVTENELLHNAAELCPDMLQAMVWEKSCAHFVHRVDLATLIARVARIVARNTPRRRTRCSTP